MTTDQAMDPADIRERALSTAVAAKAPLSRLGGDYMTSREARTAAKDLGMKGWPFYFAGRGGVLGHVEPEAVHAVFAFFPVELVREQWATALDTSRSPVLERVVDRYADLQRAWADAHLASFSEPDARQLADLLRYVAQGMESGLSPLAAAWAAMPEPSAERHRVVHWAHVLREHRGGLHIAAVQMAGLDPLEAILAGPQGDQGAKFFQWPEPYEKPDNATRLLREKAEEITDELTSRAYRGLSGPQSRRLAELLTAAVAAIG